MRILLLLLQVHFEQGMFLGYLAFSLRFQGFRGFGRYKKSLVISRVFLDKNRRSKERKDRAWLEKWACS